MNEISRRRFVMFLASSLGALLLPKSSFATPSWWSPGWTYFNPRKFYGEWMRIPTAFYDELGATEMFQEFMQERMKADVWPMFRSRVKFINKTPLEHIKTLEQSRQEVAEWNSGEGILCGCQRPMPAADTYPWGSPSWPQGSYGNIGWKYMPWRQVPPGKRIYTVEETHPDGTAKRMSVTSENHKKRNGWVRAYEPQREEMGGYLVTVWRAQYDQEILPGCPFGKTHNNGGELVCAGVPWGEGV